MGISYPQEVESGQKTAGREFAEVQVPDIRNMKSGRNKNGPRSRIRPNVTVTHEKKPVVNEEISARIERQVTVTDETMTNAQKRFTLRPF